MSTFYKLTKRHKNLKWKRLLNRYIRKTGKKRYVVFYKNSIKHKQEIYNLL